MKKVIWLKKIKSLPEQEQEIQTIAAFLSAILAGKDWSDALHLATATGALCVQTYDALSGIIPLEEVQKKIDAGWEKRK